MITLSELQSKLVNIGIEPYRAKQIHQAVFKEGKSEYVEMTTIPATTKKKLQNELPILSLRLVKNSISTDGTVQKALFATKDEGKLESVLMRFADGRLSVCVSSQIGCQLGCKFCATGTMKFGRNLTYEEIADQVLYFAQILAKENKKISNIVFMGMGEPFMNYSNVIKAITFINDPNALAIGARHITISTSGICEGIEKLSTEPLQVNLAVSLHAPNQDLRQKIMPIARKYHLNQLMKALNEYLMRTKRRVSYEYVMLKNINDHPTEAYELAELVKDQLCHINLIPYNKTDIESMSGSDKDTIRKFRDIIKEKGIPVTIRVTIGQEIDAACGQLANKNQ